MAKVLTAAAVQRLRPGKVRREIPDGGSPGLRLVIQPGSGAKSWAMRFRRPGGKAAKLTLGPVDLSGKESEDEPVIGQPLTLASARRLATAVQRQRAMGKDVVAARHRERLERAARGDDTFSRAVVDFIKQHAMRKTRRWSEQASLLGLHPDDLTLIPKGLAERWAERPVAEIDGDDIHGIIEEAIEHGVPGLVSFAKGRPSEARGRTLYGALSKMFSWLGEKRRVRVSPCIGVARPPPSLARDRVLGSDEIVAFWRAASAERAEIEGVLKLLLLTGCRLREVADMRRAELMSDDGANWTIPGTRTKNHRAHTVPLPPLARELIAAGDGEFAFTTNGKPLSSNWSKIKNRLDARMNIPPWRIHDLRRTAATGMAEIGIAPHIVEAVLNHVSGAVAGVYNRAAYAPEKKAALERWAAHVEGLVTGKAAKVVPMKAQAS